MSKAKGIPDRRYYGAPGKDFTAGQLIDYVIQKHHAERAGPHYDLRAGNKEKGLHSWVTRKELPEAGGRLLLIHQPVHSYRYKDFEGEIGPGYGKGTVKKVSDGKLLITKATKDQLHFTTADNKPERRYAVIRTGKSDDYQWLLTRPHNLSHPKVEKPKMKNIDADKLREVLKNLKGDEHVQAKIDGALNFVQILKNKPELLSHRTSKETGLPIVHTERFFGGRPEIEVPKKYQGAVLLSEVYGTRKGKAIPPQELGGILNSTIDKSLDKQKKTDVKLKAMLFDVARVGGKKIDPATVPYSERHQMLEEIIKYLPKGKFELPHTVKGSDQANKLLKQVSSGQHDKTVEGLVIHPNVGRAAKLKLTNEHDVYIRDIFPGEGKYFKTGAGGIKYSLTPEGPIVGKVGTGLSDELRRDMFKNPDNYIGRIARIRSQGQFQDTGAYRAPSLIAVHEDY